MNSSKCAISTQFLLFHQFSITLSVCSFIFNEDGPDCGAFFHTTSTKTAFHAGCCVYPHGYSSDCQGVETLTITRNQPSFFEFSVRFLFFKIRIPLRKLLQIVPNLRDMYQGLESANSSQTSGDKLLRALAGFSKVLQDGSSNSCKGAALQSDSSYQPDKIKRLHDLLDVSAPYNYHLCSLLRAATVILTTNQQEFSNHVSDQYCITNCHRHFAFGTEKKMEASRGRTFDFCNAFCFH